MVDFDRKLNMLTSDKPPIKSPSLSKNLSISIPTVGEISPASDSTCSAYEHYLRLPELKKLWDCREFPNWNNESILRPALQALEITFRLVSTVFSDPRPYSNRREWKRKLESLAMNQLQLIAMICEDDEQEFSETRGTAPTVGLISSAGVLPREQSSTEVWKLSSNTTVVSRGSEASLLPRLATWRTAEDLAQNILHSIECEMRRCPYTLGLGEPNFSGKPNLDYDLICKPHNLQILKNSPTDDFNPHNNHENQTVYTTQQILECWIRVAQELLHRVVERIDSKEFETASNDCWMIEKIWKVLEQIEDLHLLMDPDDFLRLKSQLADKSDSAAAFCFRSRSLIEMTKSSKNLRHKVPDILGVEVDPLGGPRIEEAAMKVYRKKTEYEKIHLIQAMQAIESAVKRFYYAYKQVLVIMVGSLEAKGNQSFVSEDLLAHIFLEPTYFPSIDAAKTFLGDYWEHGRHK